MHTSNVRLPAEYQEVEYIQSSGTQYIHTEIIPTDSTGLYMKLSSQNTSSDVIYCGSNSDNTDTSPQKFGLGNSGNTLYFGWNTWQPAPGSRPATSTNTIVELENNYLNSRCLKKDGTDIVTNLSTLSSNGYGINIFGHNGRGTAQYFSSIRLYSFRISNGTSIAYDFVPCYRKLDSVIGLYDLVNDVFYTNAGSGAFTKGADIPSTTEHLVRPSGGGTTYSYDFRNKSSSDLSNDGWTVQSGTLETSAYGITSPIGADVTVGKSGLDLSNANKITITFTSVWNRDDYGKRHIQLGLVDTNFTWQNYTYLVLNSGYGTSEVGVAVNGTKTSGTDIGDIGQSTYTSTFEVDLVNKTLTGTIPGLGVSTLSLTDAQVTSIRGLTDLYMYTTQQTFYLQDMSIEVI